MVSTKALAAIALTLAIVVPIGLGYVLAVEEEEVTGWQTTNQTNISELLQNAHTAYYMEYSGVTNNSLLEAYNEEVFALNATSPAYNSVSGTVSSYPRMESGYITITIPADGAYHDITDYPAMNFTTNGYLGIHLMDGGFQEYHDSRGFHYDVRYAFGYLTIDNSQFFTGVDHISYKKDLDDPENLSIAYLSPIPGSFAEASAGWTLPAGFSDVRWTNNQENRVVTFVVTIDVGQSATIGPIQITRPTSTTLVNGQELGNYQFIQVKYGGNQTSVSGLASLPSMSSAPTIYNTINLTTTPGIIKQISLAGTATFRVDSAEVAAGYYPSTKDLTLDLSDYFPTSRAVKLNSIGLYGDVFGINGTDYPVVNGKITVDGLEYSLRGAMIASLKLEDGSYSIRLNNKEIAVADSPATLHFGGEWSVVATAYALENITGKQMAWHAGEFAFDKTTLCAAGLLTCGALLVVLGLTGRNSGVKIGSLLLVLGGAAMAYIIII